MAKKLYVGNLPYSATDEILRTTFEQAGAVASASIIIDKFSGRSKGFGFVEMENDDEAMKAIEMFHDQEMDGRKMIVNEARPLTERPPRREGGYAPRGGGDRGGFSRGGDRGGFSRGGDRGGYRD